MGGARVPGRALQTLDAKSSNALVKERPRMLGLAQQRGLTGPGAESKPLTPMVANIPRNEFDQLQRPFSFLASVGGRETAAHLFTAEVDKNLLRSMKARAF